MKIRMRLFFVAILCLYVGLFLYHASVEHRKKIVLQPSFPAGLARVMSGYAQQLWADALYIKVAVFLGSRDLPEIEIYKDNLHHHFQVMQALHAKLLDIYYLSESSLAWVSKDDTKNVNIIMEQGIAQNEGEWILYFFKAFNTFYYLNEPILAADVLYRTSVVENAPTWLMRLATVLSAKGGGLHVGLNWLQVMLESEEVEEQRIRYEKDIITFKKAILVQQALLRYKKEKKFFPKVLQDLVPHYLTAIPVIKGDQYELSYINQKLRLLRTQ